MTIHDRLVKVPKGARALSVARLRYEVLKVLHAALHRSGLNQSELAGRLGVRKSAVNQVLRGDGNVRISTLAEYLHEAGFELEVRAVPLGRPREDAVREMHVAWVMHTATREDHERSAAFADLANLTWHDVGEESRAKVRAERPRSRAFTAFQESVS
jgi:transcriptional regulator with XRE-family HTH domain